MRQTGWREPTSVLPLRFGSHRSRQLGAVSLLVAGGAALQFASVYTLPLALIGVLASVAGWILVPARGWRRAVAVGPGFLGVAGMLGGAQFGALIALTLAGWLLVRERPLVSYAVVVLPVLAAAALGQSFPQYGAGVAVATILGLILIASAWLARGISRRVFAVRRNVSSEIRTKVP